MNNSVNRTIKGRLLNLQKALKSICMVGSLVTLIPGLSHAQYAASTCMGAQTVEMNFDGGIVAGIQPTPAAPVSGMTVTYQNVLINTPITQQVDAVFTLDDISWGGLTAEFTSFNPDVTSTGILANFQPSFIPATGSIATPVGTYNLYHKWTVRFYIAGTNTPAYLPITAQVVDNDGSSANASSPTRRVEIYESITFNTLASSVVTSPNGVTPSNETLSGQTFTVNTPTALLGVGTNPEYSAYANYGNTAVIQFTFNHQIIYTSTTTTASFNNGSRLSSLHIGCDYAGSNPFTSVQLSGKVYNDANGLTNSTVDGALISQASGSTLYANLLSQDGKTVLASIPVSADGTYSFNVGANANYLVQISTTQGLVASAGVVPTLPNNWVATGESNNGLGSSSDGIPDLTTLVAVGSSNVDEINFGIEEKPVATVKAFNVANSDFSSTPPAGYPSIAGYVSIPSSSAALTGYNGTGGKLSGTDPEDCSSTDGCNTGNTFVIGTINSNTILYYDFGAGPVQVNSNTSISNYDPAKLMIYGLTGSGTAANPLGFTYAIKDAAGVESQVVSYTIASATPLPLILLYFSGTSDDCMAHLEWLTGAEEGISGFELQRSEDGIHFTTGAILPAKGSNASYAAAMKHQSDALFRLKIKEQSGHHTYSKTLKINASCAVSEIAIYPNPAEYMVKVNGLKPGDKVSVVDAEGKTILPAQALRDGLLNIAALPSANYMIVISQGAVQIATLKLQKK